MDEVRRVPRMWWGGLLLAGLLALLWGTGTAVAADAVRGAEQRMIAAAEVGDLIITGVTIAGPNSTITITNVSGADIDLEGTFVCNFPSYFRLGAFALADGDSVTVSAEAGSDGNGVIFAAGGFGELGSPGEVALYKNEGFGDSSAIIAYVGWNGGLLRKGVAQAAGLWETWILRRAPATGSGRPALALARTLTRSVAVAAEVRSRRYRAPGAGASPMVMVALRRSRGRFWRPG